MVDDLAQRIGAARKARGWKLARLAREAEVDADRLQALEHGTLSAVSTAALVRIQRALDLSDWRRDPADDVHVADAFFRQSRSASFTTKDEEALVEHLREAARYRVVRGWLGVGAPLAAAVKLGAAGGKPHEDGYRAARDFRRAMGNADGPITDLKSTIESDVGVLVRAHAFRARSVRAMTVKSREDVVIVLAERAVDGVARRTDLAHELAHALLDAPRASSSLWVDLANEDTHTTSRIEKRARAFAAELLVPLAGLRASFGKPSAKLSLEGAAHMVEDVRRRFIVTTHVAVNHLKDLGYVPEEFRDALIESARPMRLATNEEWDAPALDRALRRAVDEGKVSRARALEMVGRSLYDELP